MRNLKHHSRTTFILLILLILALASIVRLSTYARYLPYVDYGDELNMYMLALDWRGTPQAEQYGAFRVGEWLKGYPPLYVWLSMSVQQTLENNAGGRWLPPGDYVRVLRLLSVAAGVATTGLIIWTGVRVGGLLAGVVAGMVWSIAPLVLEANNLAIPDTLVYLACAAALAFALEGWICGSTPWVTGSVAAALVAIYAKYTPVFALLPPLLVLAVLLRRQRKRVLPWALLDFLLIAAAAIYLLTGYSATSLANQEADVARDSGLALMLNPARNWNNFLFSLLPIGAVLFAPIMLSGAAAWFISRRRGWKTLKLFPLVLLVIFGAPGIPLSAAFTYLNPGSMMRIRHVLPTTIALTVLFGGALAQITWTIREWMGSGSRLPRAAAYFPAIVVLLVWAVPAAAGDQSLIRQFSLPYTKYLLWKWTDANIPPDGMILMRSGSELNNTWNRPWSGYDGATAFQWWFEDNLPSSTPEQYAARGMAYFAMSSNDRDALHADWRFADWLDQLTPVKTIAGSPDAAGPTIEFYRLLAPQHPASTVFGGQITLVGYDLSEERYAPGDTLRFRPYWRSLRLPDTNYSMFAHLLPAGQEQQVAQFDGPLSAPTRPTLTWDDEAELHIGTDVSMIIPADAASGTYQLALGVYDYSSGARLLREGESDAFLIPITIRKPP
jgi:hypothetical protein